MGIVLLGLERKLYSIVLPDFLFDAVLGFGGWLAIRFLEPLEGAVAGIVDAIRGGFIGKSDSGQRVCGIKTK